MAAIEPEEIRPIFGILSLIAFLAGGALTAAVILIYQAL